MGQMPEIIGVFRLLKDDNVNNNNDEVIIYDARIRRGEGLFEYFKLRKVSIDSNHYEEAKLCYEPSWQLKLDFIIQPRSHIKEDNTASFIYESYDQDMEGYNYDSYDNKEFKEILERFIEALSYVHDKN